ncbi:protoporphyrinogen oxidase [Aestuariimicrobium ganziense]|uniref:protoporphyrinogen oxidase n=1 Tax=Aestuariimicrobium ganziense TaxID=2773677 RepID=UPI0019447EC6|nr:protoporphyrinogen oxidase [Aestuariimicrobium ganziense]
MNSPIQVVVVGGGLSGLTAARALSGVPGLQVTVLESGEGPGGQVATIEVPSRRTDEPVLVDVGAESVPLSVPPVATLVDELGLTATAVVPEPGPVLLKSGRRLVPLPAGVSPTGPTQVWPVLRSGMLSLPGLVRAGLEPLFCRKVTGDISVGAFVHHRFGGQVVDRFVDPLLGNIHAGNVHGLSLQATAPQLVPVARDGESLLRRALVGSGRKAPVAGRPVRPGAVSWPTGVAALAEALAEQCGASVQYGRAVSSLERDGEDWLVHTDGHTLRADHVVLTTPTTTTAELVRPHCSELARAMAWVRTATVATVVLGYDRAAAGRNRTLRTANAVLLSSRQAETMRSMTNLSRKWPSRHADAEHHLVRIAVGNAQRSTVDSLDDETMVRRCADELGALIGLRAEPQFARVVRWPRVMPQLAPGHPDRVAKARAALAELGGLHVAGAPVDGPGVVSAITSGRTVAAQVLAARG